MSHQSQLIKNTIIIAIGKLGTQVISYFLLPIYTALLTPGDYGTYDFICTLAIFICPLITLLMEESMFRFLIDAKSEPNYYIFCYRYCNIYSNSFVSYGIWN